MKKLWNMNVTMTPIVFGALGTVFNDQEKRHEELEIRGRIETMQIIPQLKST